VALLGVDKLLPDLKTALNILKVLPRNATGQAITSYVTWVKGANACAVGPEGKKEMHIVFLDNGRLALAKDPLFSEALRCVRCGACANVCPVYRMVGGHVHGHVYIGAIGLILTLFYHGRDNARAIVKNCLNCQSCASVCPGKIDLPHLIKQVAKRVMEEDGGKPAKNHLLSMAMKNRRLFHFLLRAASKGQKPVAKNGYIRHLPSILGREHDFRSLPALAPQPLRDQWKEIQPRVSAPKYKVAFFGGCVVDFVYPEQARAMVEVLENHHVQVDFPMDQTCCGLPAMMMGENATAQEVARQNIKAMAAQDYDYILVLCASCGSHLKENYPKLMTEKFEVPEPVRELSDKIIDFSSFLTQVLKVEPTEFTPDDTRVTYHSPCHLCRGLGVTEPPRDLLEISGVDYAPSKDEDVCCGFGGSFSVDFPEISSKLLERKLDNAQETRADVLVTDCPGCILQIRGGMDKREDGMEVIHMAELLARLKK
ncbi:MAG: 4Fe-4S dicluster domain-containing protein, partial [Desulfobacterales bacterium]|nr:4Fe-4S dicluster domain-containing protein [Desulfobacterales bacterium]